MLTRDFKEFAELLNSNRVEYLIDGIELSFISLADFKTNKRAAGRLKDLADLESLGDDS